MIKKINTSKHINNIPTIPLKEIVDEIEHGMYVAVNSADETELYILIRKDWKYIWSALNNYVLQITTHSYEHPNIHSAIIQMLKENYKVYRCESFQEIHLILKKNFV